MSADFSRIRHNPLLDWAGVASHLAGLNAQRIGGYDDWRLPNRSELDSLARRGRAIPAADPVVAALAAQPVDFAQLFWSATPKVDDSALAWAVDFFYGDVTPVTKSTAARVIYVRNHPFNGQ